MTFVSSVMHVGVASVDATALIADVANLMEKSDVGAVPVQEGDRLIGIITDRDIVVRGVAARKDPATLTAGDVMTKRVAHCRTNDTVAKAVSIMERRQVRRLPVIDDGQRMIGMLSMGDLCHCSEPAAAAKVTAAVSAHHA